MSSLSSSDAEAGFTGLEAAIVLIAFVVVASIFSYTVLAAGFHFSGESQSVIHQGIQQAGSSCTWLELSTASVLSGITKIHHHSHRPYRRR